MKIITVGDSHTAGYPGFDPLSRENIHSTYQFWLQQALEDKKSQKVEILNFGLPGDTSNGILKRTLDILENYDLSEVKLFIINGGGNDYGIVPIDYTPTLTNLLETCKMIRKRNIPVILTSMSPFGNQKIMQQLQTIANELKRLIADENDEEFFYFDWFNTIFDRKSNGLNPDFNSGDNEHLNIDGYRFIANAIFKFINKTQNW
jgi:lysophospholipase L1-like esterase